MATERAVIEIELVFDLLVDVLRNAHRTGLGESLEPGGDVDAIAKDVLAVDDHVAEIDADPQLKAALSRDRVVDRARRRCISTAQFSASTTLEKSASRLSPAMPTIRPPWVANIQACLIGAGVKASDIVLTRAYVAATEVFAKNADVRIRYLGPESPESTISAVPTLAAGPDFVVEIEAVANLNTPAKAGTQTKP